MTLEVKKVSESPGVEGSNNFRTKADVLVFIDDLKQMARNMLDGSGTVPLMAAVFDGPNSVKVIMADQVPGVATKDTFAKLIRMLVQQTKAIGCIFMFESWVLELSEEEHKRHPIGSSIENHPKRKEAVFLSLEHAEFAPIQWKAYISRAADNSPILGEFSEFAAGATSSGRFTSVVRPSN